MVIKKRCLLWDWTNTKDIPHKMAPINFSGPMHSVSNWNTWIPPELQDRASFRPMIRDLSSLTGEDWHNITSTKDGIIHFFNEPERAGISPQKAAEVWFEQVLPLRQNGHNKLVSPSCASDPQGQAWIVEFMQLVAEDPPDYLGLHYYGTDSQAAIQYFQEMYARFPEQMIIISELASISRDYKDVVAFTVDAVNWADETEWVFEYGIFGCMRSVADGFVSPAAQLMGSDGEFEELMVKLMEEQPMRK